MLTVVGSKGKGTAATYASAALASSGLRAGTLTSPGLRSNRERIRVDGSPIPAPAYAGLVDRVAETATAVAARLPDDGYLSPTGLFTLAAARHFIDTGCDVWVLEAGMGGAGDEVSLFNARAVTVCPIFAEHIGILGETVAEIAREKLGVITVRTAFVVGVEQSHAEVRALIDGRMHCPVLAADSFHALDAAWPPGLSAANARAGVSAALRLIDSVGWARPSDAMLRASLQSVRLPGRLSVHRHEDATWVVDAAVDRAGAGAALRWTDRTVGNPGTVLVSLPDGKDVSGVFEVLRSLSPVALRTAAPHLTYGESPAGSPSLTELATGSLAGPVLALGSTSFISDLLELLDVDTSTAYSAPSRELTFQHSMAVHSRS